jgi:hypothetical protein
LAASLGEAPPGGRFADPAFALTFVDCLDNRTPARDNADIKVHEQGEEAQRMQRRLRALAVAFSVIAVALVAASLAGAGSAIPVSGEYLVSDLGSTSCVPVGPFKFRCDTTGLVSQYSGDLTGTAVADFTALINCKTGRETGHGTETFIGSLVGGGSGTLSWIDQFSSDFDCNSFFPFNLDINSVAVKGSGGFAGLQGRLTFTDTTYSGVLH